MFEASSCIVIRLLASIFAGPGDDMEDEERTPLLQVPADRGLSKIVREEEIQSILDSHVTEEEQKLSDSSVGERLA